MCHSVGTEVYTFIDFSGTPRERGWDRVTNNKELGNKPEDVFLLIMRFTFCKTAQKGTNKYMN
jgi:hypothetical protein